MYENMNAYFVTTDTLFNRVGEYFSARFPRRSSKFSVKILSGFVPGEDSSFDERIHSNSNFSARTSCSATPSVDIFDNKLPKKYYYSTGR